VDELLIWAHIVVSDRVELVGERQQLLPTDIRIWRKALQTEPMARALGARTP